MTTIDHDQDPAVVPYPEPADGDRSDRAPIRRRLREAIADARDN